MAKDGSPERIGERAMFSRDAQSFALPSATHQPVSPLAHHPSVSRAELVDDAPIVTGSLRPSFLADCRSRAVALWKARPPVPSRSAATRALQSAVSTELDRGIAFILAPVFLAAGALIYFSIGHEPGFLPLAAGTLGLAVIAFAARARPVMHMAIVAALLCVLGALFAKAETWRAGTKMLGGEVTTKLSGRVAEIEHLADGRVRLTIDVTGTERPVLRYAPDRVRASARKIPESLEAGSAITGLVRLMPPSGPVRPGSYDFSFESYFDGIGASGFFLRGPELVASSDSPSLAARFHAAVERAREAISDRIRDGIGGAEGEIAAALVVGVRAGIPEDVNEALRRAGIYHIISISGLHMALVAGTIMVLLRAGFALFPDFSSRHPVKKYAAALAILGLASYLFISGAEVAAQRSFIMLAVMLTAVLFDRAALTLRNLAIAAIVVIVLSPHEVVGPSFQMSFAATAALVGAYAAWADWRTNHPGEPPATRLLVSRALRYVLLATAGLAVTSIVAGGATAIYAAWHFQQMPSLGLFTNLAAMPVVSTVVMPFAVLGALAMPFGLDGPFFHIMGLGLSATIAIAKWFAERSPADIVGLVPPAAVAVLTAALLVATVTSTWLRVAAIPVALIGLLLLLDRPKPDLFVSEDGRVVGLDLGNGSIAVNRARPNEFTVDNWKRAMRADEIVRPKGKQERASRQALLSPSLRGEDAGRQVRGSADAAHVSDADVAFHSTDAGVAPYPYPLPVKNGERGASASAPAFPVDAAKSPFAGFTCSEGLCIARHPSGAVVAHTLDAQAALDVCATASVIVIDDATAKNVCRWKDVLVVSKRDLALSGSAAIAFSGDGSSAEKATIEYAISRPFRPWHQQRSFSRAARGLQEYKRPDKPQKPGDVSPTVPDATSSPERADQADQADQEIAQ